MASFVLFRNPDVRIDIMILQKYWPKLVSIIERTECTYYREDWLELENGRKYVALRDVKADRPHRLGELIGLFYSLEWDSLTDTPDETKSPEKFYILIKPRKKGGKHVQRNRQETGAGSEGGSAGGSGPDVPGKDPGAGRSGAEPFVVGFYDIRQLEKFDPGREAPGFSHNY